MPISFQKTVSLHGYQPPYPGFMHPITRRVLQAVLYEVGAIALTGPILGVAFDASAGSALLLATIMSSIALAWNYVFNALFERWEAKQATKGRSVWRRLAHGIGFEGGLAVMLVPLMTYWLQTSLLEALLAEVGILLVFFVYAIAFTWAFDKCFGLPASAVGR
jgi:uncharacterized membrane protein